MEFRSRLAIKYCIEKTIKLSRFKSKYLELKNIYSKKKMIWCYFFQKTKSHHKYTYEERHINKFSLVVLWQSLRLLYYYYYNYYHYHILLLYRRSNNSFELSPCRYSCIWKYSSVYCPDCSKHYIASPRSCSWSGPGLQFGWVSWDA